MKLLIDKHQIAAKVKEIALVIDREYKEKNLVIVMVLKGSLCLVADLIRELTIPFDIEVVQALSYGERGTQRGKLEVLGIDRLPIQARDVLLVDDIFDSGHTMTTLIDALRKKQPHSIKSLVLLSKNVPHVTDYRPDYVLFDIENRFVVGYGLDYKEKYRGLPGIYVMKQ